VTDGAYEVYLGEPGDQAFAVLHPARGSSRVAVVFCPPFGWEEITSYRVRRGWAEHLARGGVTCLRLTLPATGDSGGDPRAPQRVRAWTTAIDEAARHLRSEAHAEMVVALGLGLGGLLACRAAADSRGLDGAVLWAAPARGADAVRQLRAFGRLERSTFWTDGQPRSALRDGEIEAGGFMLSGETRTDLEALDVEHLELAGAMPEGALLLDRDGIAVDERWVDALQRAGIPCERAPGEGYADMTSHPQTAQMPAHVVDTVDRWLSQRVTAAPRRRAEPPPAPVPAADELRLAPDGRSREVPLTVVVDGVALRGIQTISDQARTDLVVVFLNAGAQRRVGPNRMWVEASRRWAAWGVSSVRLDVEGIGDSDGGLTPYRANRALNSFDRVDQVVGAVRELRALGVGDRFMLVGLCGGAYWAFHSLIREPSVCAAVPINPYAIIWSDELAPSRDLRRIFTDRSWALVRKNATRERMRALARWLVMTPARWSRSLPGLRGRPTAQPTEAELLDRVMASDKRLTFIFSEREPLLAEFRRTGRLTEFARTPHVVVHSLAVNDHTLRPSWAQEEVHRLLDDALIQELAEAPDGGVLTAPGSRSL
jgi:dienelactone hydrolase